MPAFNKNIFFKLVNLSEKLSFFDFWTNLRLTINNFDYIKTMINFEYFKTGNNYDYFIFKRFPFFYLTLERIHNIPQFFLVVGGVETGNI